MVGVKNFALRNTLRDENFEANLGFALSKWGGRKCRATNLMVVYFLVFMCVCFRFSREKKGEITVHWCHVAEI